MIYKVPKSQKESGHNNGCNCKTVSIDERDEKHAHTCKVKTHKLKPQNMFTCIHE